SATRTPVAGAGEPTGVDGAAACNVGGVEPAGRVDPVPALAAAATPDEAPPKGAENGGVGSEPCEDRAPIGVPHSVAFSPSSALTSLHSSVGAAWKFFREHVKIIQ